MISTLNPEQTAVKAAIDRIENRLHAMLYVLEQNKADFGNLGWPEAAELNYIAGQLDTINAFWTQSGEEYQPC